MIETQFTAEDRDLVLELCHYGEAITAVGRHPVVHMPSIGLVDRCWWFAH